MRQFLETIFKRCRGEKGRIALRAFEHEHEGRIVLNEWVPFDRDLPGAAVIAASRIALREGPHRAVFSPPVCIFGDQKNDRGQLFAGQTNVVCAPVIAVELDKHPTASLNTLVAVLGEPTLVIASGGKWEGEDKLHAYWRLGHPAKTDADQATLTRVRGMATRLVDGDPTAVSLVHPMRWAGSWHTKGLPRLCRIVGGEPDRDLKLEWARDVLEEALLKAGLSFDGPNTLSRAKLEGKGFKTNQEWSADELKHASRVIPNNDVEWDRWNVTGMAFYDASHGSAEGLDAFIAWSEKSMKGDADAAALRWKHFAASPPTDISAGKLMFLIRQVDPDYKVHRDIAADCFEQPDKNTGDTAEWPEPIDIFGDEDPLELGEPPAGSLPPILEQFARSEARRKGVSLAFAASAALGVVAAAIGGSLRIQVRQKDTGWAEPAPLWLALVADPGRAKSPTISQATRPLREFDTEQYRAWKAVHDVWAAAGRAHKRKGSAPHPGPEPIMRRTAVDDITFEAQVRIHADNPRGLLRTPDELMSFLASFGAYKASGDGDRTQMLRLFDGDAITIDRVGAGSIRAEQALMGIVAGTQPEKIRKITRDLGADGMLQRFLFVLDDGKERRGLDEAPDERAASGYRALLRELASASYPDRSTLRMTSEAHEAFNEAAEAIEGLRGLVGMPEAWRGHVQKWGKFLPRIVLTMHCVDQFSLYGQVDPTLPIDKMSVERAAKFARFLLRHSLTFYRQNFEPDEADEESRWFAGYLLTHPAITSVDHRVLYDARKSLRGDGNRRMRTRILKSLEDAGWLRIAEQGAEGPARCDVNPLVHARFEARTEWERRDREAKRASIERSKEARLWLASEEMDKTSTKAEAFR